MCPSPHLRRATTCVLLAVALIGGAVLMMGDRFGAAPRHTLVQPVRSEAPEPAGPPDVPLTVVVQLRLTLP